MKAVMYGGGNIGRGFIGLLFQQSGYEVTFIDVSKDLIQDLNEKNLYSVRILSNTGYEDIAVKDIYAIDGNDTNVVATAIAGADLMATAVGVNVLPDIVTNLVAGIRQRFATTSAPLNILICENLLDADQVLMGLIKERLSNDEQALFDERIGLVEASIGRMVPVQTEYMKQGDPLRVCVERYGWLPVDKDAFKGTIPDIKGLVPYSPFGYYIKRKLFVHNLGHSMCAYLGLYAGYRYIWQAIDDPDILILVKNAMLESICALSAEYETPVQDLLLHVDDLLHRFKNQALGDTCARVGADSIRKLGPNDRLIGAARMCEKHGIMPRHISVGIAAGVFRYLLEQGKAQSEANAMQALSELSGLEADETPTRTIIESYKLHLCGTRARQLRNTVEELAEKNCGRIV